MGVGGWVGVLHRAAEDAVDGGCHFACQIGVARAAPARRAAILDFVIGQADWNNAHARCG